MVTSLAALTSSFFSLSLSSQISQNPSLSFSFTQSKPLSLKSAARKFPTLTVASSSAVADPEVETVDIEKLVKSRLPGGFAAQTIIGTGRRKCAIARVVLLEGTGKVYINYRAGKEYLQGNPLWMRTVKAPLEVFGYERTYDVFVKAHGGGLGGQAQAISLGVSRALLKLSLSHRSPLKQEGFLTRDSRIVERKKVGQPKARKRKQFSKR